MFRIIQVDVRHERHLIVEGRLVSACVEELRRVWLDARLNVDRQRIVIDVSEVTLISAEGRQLLRELSSEGALFVGGGVYVKGLLYELGIYQDPFGLETRDGESSKGELL